MGNIMRSCLKRKRRKEKEGRKEGGWEREKREGRKEKEKEFCHLQQPR
jgi:hypothetical protein